MKTKPDEFTKGYIEAALWSSTCEPFGKCAECGTEDKILYWNKNTREHELCEDCRNPDHDSPWEPPMDAHYSVKDLAEETLAKIVADCAKFQTDNAELISAEFHTVISADNLIDSYAGHDFWLTRNGHGAGFWDGDWTEPTATKLTQAAKAFGECTLYVGDDGKLHIS